MLMLEFLKLFLRLFLLADFASLSPFTRSMSTFLSIGCKGRVDGNARFVGDIGPSIWFPGMAYKYLQLPTKSSGPLFSKLMKR